MRIKDIINQKTCVECSTKKEYISFLKAAEKEGLKWLSGDLPTQHYEYWNNEPLCINYNNGLGRCFSLANDCTVINFSDLNLADVCKENYQLEIEQRNRSVLARLYDDKDVFVKFAKAVCSPEDEFDFEVGKKIALQRLFEIEPEKETNKKAEDCHKMILESIGGFDGNVGEPTKIKAFGNAKLYVGDVVELFDPWGDSRGLKCICKDQFCPDGFVMGVAHVKDFENGFNSNCGGWLIIKRKSYTEMSVGDTVGTVEYKLT